MERSRLVPEMLGEMTGTWRWFGSEGGGVHTEFRMGDTRNFVAAFMIKKKRFICCQHTIVKYDLWI